MHATIITARSGSESIPQKNILDINGRPMLEYPIQASKEAKLIDEVFVSTDGDDIASVAAEAGASVLNRPDQLQGDVSHGDVIKHAIRTVDEKHSDELKTAVILLGNSVMVDGDLIDLTINAVQTTDADSAMTVWQAEDDHPQRAMKINTNGFLQSYGGEYDAENTNRQNYTDVYYYDNGPWTLKPECVENQNGPGAWWWMGEKCVPVEREWVTGRDIHDHFDVAFQKFYADNRETLIDLEDRTILSPTERSI
jgi:CMP-N-acetylneuraminic acid synthetase